VLGTHGRGAPARFLLGSISHEVLGRLSTVTAIVRRAETRGFGGADAIA